MWLVGRSWKLLLTWNINNNQTFFCNKASQCWDMFRMHWGVVVSFHYAYPNLDGHCESLHHFYISWNLHKYHRCTAQNWISPLECIISILLISCSGFWNIINNNMGSIHCIIHNIKISSNYISEYLSTLCDISMSYCTGLLKCLCTMIPTLWLPNLRTTKALDPLPFFYGLLILHLTVFGRIF